MDFKETLLSGILELLLREICSYLVPSEFDTTFSLIDKYKKCVCYKLRVIIFLSTDSLSSKIEMLVHANLPNLGCVCKYVQGRITWITIKAYSS